MHRNQKGNALECKQATKLDLTVCTLLYLAQECVQLSQQKKNMFSKKKSWVWNRNEDLSLETTTGTWDAILNWTLKVVWLDYSLFFLFLSFNSRFDPNDMILFAFSNRPPYANLESPFDKCSWIVSIVTWSHSTFCIGGTYTQCGNLRIYVLLRFYVKSKLRAPLRL